MGWWQVKVYCHEGEGEGNEHLDSMDLLDVKSELERDAEKSEVSITFIILVRCITCVA